MFVYIFSRIFDRVMIKRGYGRADGPDGRTGRMAYILSKCLLTVISAFYLKDIQKDKTRIWSKKLFQHFLSHIIVFRDMVWKLSKLQSSFNELEFYVKPYLTSCTSFVLSLLIFKYHGWMTELKRCYWMIRSVYWNTMCSLTVHRAQNCINANKKIEQRL
jgi:hypothetical protein